MELQQGEGTGIELQLTGEQHAETTAAHVPKHPSACSPEGVCTVQRKWAATREMVRRSCCRGTLKTSGTA